MYVCTYVYICFGLLGEMVLVGSHRKRSISHFGRRKTAHFDFLTLGFMERTSSQGMKLEHRGFFEVFTYASFNVLRNKDY